MRDVRRQAADDALTAALNKSDLETAEPIHVETLDTVDGNEFEDLPDLGAWDTDHSKYDADMENASQAFEAVAKSSDQGNDPRHWLEGDGLGVVDQTVDDLRGIPPMPGRDPDQIPGLPEKNLGLDV
jgi:hypothetical protein